MSENFIIKYLQDTNYNLINISQYNIEELCNKVKILHEEDNDYNILYYFSKDTTNIFRRYMEIGFTIPTAYNILVIFYKGDYFYTNEDVKNLEPLKGILQKADKKIYTKCDLCKEIRQHLMCCNKCDNRFCKKCIREGLQECNKCGTLIT